MKPQDLYIKQTDPSGKNRSVIIRHRVWDADRFIESQRQTFKSLAEKDPSQARQISISSRDEFLNQNRK